MEHTLKHLEARINEVCWRRAMDRVQHSKSMKTWDRLGRKMEEYKERERDKIINWIVNMGEI